VSPETRYARSDDVHIAFQVVGQGPPDLVVAELDAQWEEPSFGRFLERLGSTGRLVCFDRRGTGVSDPIDLSRPPALEEWMDDVPRGFRCCP
jgi:hypothetical protein